MHLFMYAICCPTCPVVYPLLHLTVDTLPFSSVHFAFCIAAFFALMDLRSDMDTLLRFLSLTKVFSALLRGSCTPQYISALHHMSGPTVTDLHFVS